MSRPKAWILAIAALGILAAGCSSEGTQVSEPSPEPATDVITSTPQETVAETTPEVTPVPAPSCPNEEAARSDETLRLGGAMEGDFDGDGAADVAALHLDRGGEIGCRAFVVVSGTQGTVSAPVWLLDETAGLPEPSLAFATEINGAPGAEIIVNEAAGASTQFVGVLTISDGALVRVASAAEGPEHWTGEAGGIFPSGGSVGHAEAVDCVGPGRVVVSEAVPGSDPEIFMVIRRFYRLQGPVMLPESVARDRVPAADLNSNPEFGSSPFGSCG